MTGKAGVAERQPAVPGDFVQGVNRQKPQRIRPCTRPHFFHCAAMGQQRFLVRDVHAEKAGESEGRGGDAEMDLRRPRVPHHLDQAGAGRAADDGIIHQDDAPALHCLPQGVQLQADGPLPAVLAGLDEGASDVAVFDETYTVGDTGAAGIADGGRDTGVRHAHNHVRADRVLHGEVFSGLLPGQLHRRAVDHGVRAGKIDVLKGAQCAPGLYAAPEGAHAPPAVCHDYLPRLDIPDKRRAQGVQRAGLRGKDHRVPHAPHAQGPHAAGVSGGNQLLGGHDAQGVGPLQHVHGVDHGLLDGAGPEALLHQGIDQHLGVGGGAEDCAAQLQLPAQLAGVDQIAVVGQSQVPLDMGDDQGLGIFPAGVAGGGITDVADGHGALHGVQQGLMEHLAHQPHVPVAADDAPVVHRDAAGLLTPVLQGE